MHKGRPKGDTEAEQKRIKDMGDDMGHRIVAIGVAEASSEKELNTNMLVAEMSGISILGIIGVNFVANSFGTEEEYVTEISKEIRNKITELQKSPDLGAFLPGMQELKFDDKNIN